MEFQEVETSLTSTTVEKGGRVLLASDITSKTNGLLDGGPVCLGSDDAIQQASERLRRTGRDKPALVQPAHPGRRRLL